MRCGDCRYLARDASLPANAGQCRRYPPVPMLAPCKPSPANPQGVALASLWPSMGDDAGCGEFTPKLDS